MATKTSVLKLVIAGDNKGALKSITGTEKGLGGLQSKLGGIGGAVGGAFSVGAVTAFGKASLTAYSEAAGGVAKIKRLTGESAENASLLAFAAHQAGIPIDKVAASAGILATNIKKGKVDAAGIATKDGNGNLLSFDKIIAEIADKLDTLPEGFQRTALARELFGRGGADMAKILKGGSDALQEQAATMKGLGLEFTDAGLKQYGKFILTQREMQSAVTGLEVKIAQRLVPALTAAGKFFVNLNPTVRNAGLGLAGFTTVATGAALSIGLLGPPIKRTLEFLHIWPTAAGSAAASTDTLAVSQVAASQAALTESAANSELVLSLQLLGASEEEIAIATGQKAAAEEAAAAAAASEATANTGLLGTLGPLAAALGVAAGLFKGFKNATDGKFGNFSIEQQKFNDLLGATNTELVRQAGIMDAIGGGESGFVKAGKGNIDVLYAMRDALAAQGDSLPALNRAIKEVEAEEARATARKEKHAASADKAAVATQRQTNAEDHYAAALAASNILKNAQERFDLQGQVANANDDVAASLADLGEAEQAAAGNSDEYRAAVEKQKQDLKDLADAQADVTDRQKDAQQAQQDLTDAVAEARKKQVDLRQAVIDTADAQRDAATAAKRAEADLRKVIADPRTSALDKEEATNALIDAQHKAGETAAEAAKAQAESNNFTIEGDKGVIDAHQKVVDANAAIVDAQQKVKDKQAEVAADGKAKSQVLTDAAHTLRDAHNKVNESLLTQAKLQADLVAAQKGPLAGLQAYKGSLLEIAGALDPNSELSARVASFLAAIDRAISIERAAAVHTNTSQAIPPTRDPDQGARPIPTRGLRSGAGHTFNITVHADGRQVGRASARTVKSELDKIARGTR